MWVKFFFYAVLVMSVLLFGLLIYLAIDYPIVLIAIVVVTVIWIRHQLKNAVVLPPDEEF